MMASRTESGSTADDAGNSQSRITARAEALDAPEVRLNSTVAASRTARTAIASLARTERSPSGAAVRLMPSDPAAESRAIPSALDPVAIKRDREVADGAGGA